VHTPEKANNFMFGLLVFFVGGQLIFAMAIPLGIINLENFPIWLQVIVVQVGFIGIPCAAYLIAHRQNIRQILPLRPLGLMNTLMVIGMSIAIYPLTLLIGAIFGAIFGSPIGYMMTDFIDESGIWLMLLLVPVLPSIFEEVALRGIVFSGYKSVKIFTAALINGLFFGILHLNLHQFSYAFILGFIMCYMMWYTKSLWAPILCHFVVNTLATLLLYIGMGIDGEGLAAEVEYGVSGVDMTATQEFLDGLIVVGGVALVFFGIFIVIYRAFKRHNLARNDAAGIATDTYAPAERGRVLTWSLVATVALGLVMMILAL